MGRAAGCTLDEASDRAQLVRARSGRDDSGVEKQAQKGSLACAPARGEQRVVGQIGCGCSSLLRRCLLLAVHEMWWWWSALTTRRGVVGGGDGRRVLAAPVPNTIFSVHVREVAWDG